MPPPTEEDACRDSAGCVMVFKLRPSVDVSAEQTTAIAGALATAVGRVVRGPVETLEAARARVEAGQTRADVLACDDFSCLQTLGNALGVPFYMQGDVTKLDAGTWQLNVQLSDMRSMKPIGRDSLTVEGPLSAVVRAITPDRVRGVLTNVPGLVLRPPGSIMNGAARALPAHRGTFRVDDEHTVLDVHAGRLWQRDDAGFDMGRAEAGSYCETLRLAGHDDWRLPGIAELRTLIEGCAATMPDGMCGVTAACLRPDCWTDVCKGCEPQAGPAEGGRYAAAGIWRGAGRWYWSASAYAGGPPGAWVMHTGTGAVGGGDARAAGGVRCVRP